MLIAVLIVLPAVVMLLAWNGCGHDVLVYLRFWRRRRRQCWQREIAGSVRRHEARQLRAMGGK